MATVMLIGKGWQARALVRAQLIEEGVDVEAYSSAKDAFEVQRELLPELVVADLSESEEPKIEIEELAKWSRRTHIWIIAGRNLITGSELRGRGFDIILLKPIDIGELVDQIKNRIDSGAR